MGLRVSSNRRRNCLAGLGRLLLVLSVLLLPVGASGFVALVEDLLEVLCLSILAVDILVKFLLIWGFVYFDRLRNVFALLWHLEVTLVLLFHVDPRRVMAFMHGVDLLLGWDRRNF